MEFVVFDDVVVVEERSDALVCLVAGSEVVVPIHQIGLADHIVRHVGDRGRLPLPTPVAYALGVLRVGAP
jgi:hypothetical protein